MDLTDALRYLDAHTNLEAVAGRWEGLSLDRMRTLCATLADPQDAYPVIHVTGTNGKGSVTRMITGLLRAAGLSVGTYTSPHLERVNERIAWDGEPIDDATLADLIASVAAAEVLSGVEPSYFEILTLAAFLHFANQAVDVAVVEVGLLGRTDATNVADGRVAVVTNVGKDHTDGIGDWRRAIAEEKAGIIKPGATLVLGETDPDLVELFEASWATDTWRRGRDFGCDANRVALGGRVLDLRTREARYDDVYLPLHGAHQADNAALAVAAVEAFFDRPLATDVVEEALGSIVVPGRFEVVHREPTVVLDGAHNPDGARAASATLVEEFTLTGSILLVVGLLEGRDPVEMLDALGAPEAGLVIAVTPDSPRAVPAPELAALAEGLGVVAEAAGSVTDGIRRALAVATADDLILVAGSLYVVGEARSVLSSGGAGMLEP